jgi:predicted Zn-dependent protease with MMP-like domain
MSSQDFDHLVEEALASIPARFRFRLRNLIVRVELEPPRPGLLGLFQGRPLTERSHLDPAELPATITIYQRAHERAALSFPHLRQLVFDTVWHEVAHYFGMDERQVRQWERRRRR